MTVLSHWFILHGLVFTLFGLSGMFAASGADNVPESYYWQMFFTLSFGLGVLTYGLGWFKLPSTGNQ